MFSIRLSGISACFFVGATGIGYVFAAAPCVAAQHGQQQRRPLVAGRLEREFLLAELGGENDAPGVGLHQPGEAEDLIKVET
jgi:hypothetical protein